MSEHAWVLQNMASYVAGGLDDAEREQFEQHVASCDECSRARDEVRAIDKKLEHLFADARPEPGLEDRVIRAIRTVRPRRTLPFYGQLALGAAAVVLFGLLGTLVADWIETEKLRFPGTLTTNRSALDSSETEWAMLPQPGTWRNSVDQLAEQTRARVLTGLPGGDRVAGPATNWWTDKLPFVEEQGRDRAAHLETEAAGTKSVRDRTSLSVVMAEPAESSSDYDSLVKSRAGDMRRYRFDVGRFGYEQGGAMGGMPGGAEGAKADDMFSLNEALQQQSVTLGMQQPAAGGKEAAALSGYYTYRNERLAVQAPAQPGIVSVVAGDAARQIYFKPADVTVVATPVQPPQPQQESAAEKQRAEKPTAQNKPGGEEKQPEPAQGQRKIIRSGELEFEIDAFDSAVDTISRIVAEEGGFVGTVNSEKLPNGKVRGTVVVRVPPDRLDTFVLKLRALGDLKSQRIASQDITKQYTDLESRLRAARAMEERLLEMIRTGKGEIKDLLAAEKELGVWRTQIEELEGELRYYGNLIALSTLTITLSEREIRAPFAVTETERVQMGIEVEDVEKAQQEVLAAVTDADGRVTKSELKKHVAEQFSAVIHFEVSPDEAGTVRDRLRQLGHVARLDVDRLQQTEGGTGRPQDARTKRADTQFFVSLYNLANVAPRETVHINLAASDAEAAYRTILERVEQAGGRVVTSNLNRQPNDQTTGSVNFEIKAAEAEAVLADLKAAGEVMRLEVTENPDAQNVTRAKRGFQVQIWAMGTVAPRETVVMQLATRDVPAAYRSMQDAVTKAGGRVLNAQLNEQDQQNVTAQLDFEAPRDEEASVTQALSATGDVFSRSATRAQDKDNVIDSKIRWQLSLVNQARIPPREAVTLDVEVGDVDKTAELFAGLVAKSKGRTVESHLAHERNGRVTAKMVYDVPLSAAFELVQKFKACGTVRVQQSTRNPQVPESELAIARLDVTLSNAELIVPRDEGLWSQIRRGLSTSFVALSWSLIVVIVGVCFVLPWMLVVYIAYRLVHRLRGRAPSPVPAG
jgi:glycine cleavage system regulatory protein